MLQETKDFYMRLRFGKFSWKIGFMKNTVFKVNMLKLWLL